MSTTGVLSVVRARTCVCVCLCVLARALVPKGCMQTTEPMEIKGHTQHGVHLVWARVSL